MHSYTPLIEENNTQRVARFLHFELSTCALRSAARHRPDRESRRHGSKTRRTATRREEFPARLAIERLEGNLLLDEPEYGVLICL